MTFPIMGGLSRIATVVARVRAMGHPTLLFDNGDTFHGTPVAVRSKGEALLPILNALAFDAMTAHWDFAWGPKHLKALVRKLSYPLLACNCYDTATDELTFPATRVIERDGLRIGVIGLAATIVDKSMPLQFSEGIRLTSGLEELPTHIDRLRHDERVDVVIVLSHLGLPQDIKVAQSIHGIDVLLSGHTHNRLIAPIEIGGTLVIQSGCHGSFVGQLDLDVLDTGGVKLRQHTLVPIEESLPQEPEVAALIEAAVAPHRAELGQVIGRTSTALHRATTLSAPMDDLLLDAIAKAAGTELAFSNGWRYGAPIPPGPITLGDLWNIIPTDPPVEVVELTGAEILAMMEENLERTFAAEPFDQMGGFVKRCRGLHVYAKAENPPMHRIERIFVGDAPLDAERTYQAAFVTMQAVPTRYGRNRRTIADSAVQVLRDYVCSHEEVRMHSGRNIVLA